MAAPFSFRSLLTLSAGAMALTFGAACAVEVNHGAEYACVDDPTCPPGFECQAGACIATDSVDIDSGVVGQTDGRQVDAATTDAAPPDAAPPPDADPNLLEIPVAASTDDAEESIATGVIALGSSDLEFVLATDGDQVIGIRFAAVELAQGTQIESAAIQFSVDEVNSEVTNLEIYMQTDINAPTFTADLNNISLRPLTPEPVLWAPNPWTTIGEVGLDQQTPALTTLVQAMLDRPEWVSGNAMVFIIKGTGKRVADSFNGDLAPPTLRIRLP